MSVFYILGNFITLKEEKIFKIRKQLGSEGIPAAPALLCGTAGGRFVMPAPACAVIISLFQDKRLTGD